MPLTVYYHPFSQPSRTVVLFCQLNKIAHEEKIVDINKELKGPEYAAINPAQSVPAIKDDDFCLGESTAIVRYLAAKHKVADHWYPADLKARARVDAYLGWQHTGIRKAGVNLMINEVFVPQRTGKKDQQQIDGYVKDVEAAIGKMNSIFLRGKKFLCGDEMSIADLFAINEMIQPLSCPSGKDLLKNQPEMKEWMKRVEDLISPQYDDILKALKAICAQAS